MTASRVCTTLLPVLGVLCCVGALPLECNPSALQQVAEHTRQSFYVFALTQDCHLLFARADQIHLLPTWTRVDTTLTHCLPSMVQFHFRDLYGDGRVGLTMVVKRPNGQVCTFPIDFPTENALSGYALFSYSILDSMTSYAVCSYVQNEAFNLDPQQGFVSHLAEEYVIGLDTQRSQLYAVHKRDKDLSSTCAYDLLFRSRVHRRHLIPQNDASSARYHRLNSFAADVNLTLFTIAGSSKTNAAIHRHRADPTTTTRRPASHLLHRQQATPSWTTTTALPTTAVSYGNDPYPQRSEQLHRRPSPSTVLTSTERSTDKIISVVDKANDNASKLDATAAAVRSNEIIEDEYVDESSGSVVDETATSAISGEQTAKDKPDSAPGLASGAFILSISYFLLVL